MITIIELHKEHAKVYRELRLKGLMEAKETFGSSYEEESLLSLSHYENQLDDLNNTVLGAWSNEKLVGILLMRRSNHMKTKHNGHLHAMYVDHDFQKQGIGKSLLLKMMRIAKDMGIINIFLTVTKTNHEAIKLYESVGFHIYGTEKREILIDGKYLDSLLMAFYH
ncbi:MAG TPA: GNAT family N-acetyltransferase [Acholeplasmataceae bacterium]|nr:GNAT family N-acetyltransferase [Acholeplasmataceae bacterium]HRX45078.1 GNAT family N-acetyltransferase [Acholeplasmataceae bacterium]